LDEVAAAKDLDLRWTPEREGEHGAA